jgi:hypothetical protein
LYRHPHREVYVDDKKLAKLIRKNAAKAENLAKARQGRAYDPTLAATRGPEDVENDLERQRMFKEMKRREF